MIPPGWRPSRHGDGLRRRLGPVALSVYRRREGGAWLASITVVLDVHDMAEACGLAEALAARLLTAAGVDRGA